jgi:alpha-mannosidase
VREIMERWDGVLRRAGVEAVLLCNGSDHLPVMRELPSVCAELETRLPGARFAIARFSDYVRAIEGVEVPAWSGELLGSRVQNVLRGVNSARLYVKQANELAERRLSSVETLAALRTCRDGTPFPHSDFTLAWRQLLQCHPHDTICGCSCDEVHRDALVRYESLHRTLSVLQAGALRGHGRVDPPWAGVINVLPFRRRGLVEVAGAEPTIVELDGFAATTVELAPSRSRSSGAMPGAAIENDLIRIEADPDGALTLVDLARGTRLEHLHAFEDEPDMGDLYTFCPTEEAQVRRSGTAAVQVLRDGPVVSELELHWELSLPVGLSAEFRPERETVGLGVTTIVRLVRGSRRVEFRTMLDNPARDHRLRVCFPVGVARDPARAEGQFALVRRALDRRQPATEWAEPPDPTDHTLGAVALGPIALLTKGLPEYEARVSDGRAELCLTLLRCVGVIAQPGGVLASRPQHAGPRTLTPEGQCLGRHEFEYALVPGADALDDVALLRESQDYRHGLLTVPEAVDFEPPLALEGDVVFSCLKGAEDGDGLIMRCFNPAAAPAEVRVGGPVAVSRVRLDETTEESPEDGRLQLRPGEIGTLRLRRLGTLP